MACSSGFDRVCRRGWITAGIYRPYHLSFKPAIVLKSEKGSIKGKAGFARPGCGTVCHIHHAHHRYGHNTLQLDYLNTRNLGYDKTRSSPSVYNELVANYDAFYNELTKNASIKSAARSSRVPTGRLLDRMVVRA